MIVLATVGGLEDADPLVRMDLSVIVVRCAERTVIRIVVRAVNREVITVQFSSLIWVAVELRLK